MDLKAFHALTAILTVLLSDYPFSFQPVKAKIWLACRENEVALKS